MKKKKILMVGFHESPFWRIRASKSPLYPPSEFIQDDKAVQEKIAQWLPTQSPRLKRAWADDIVDQQPKEQALQWIEQLSTAPH